MAPQSFRLETISITGSDRPAATGQMTHEYTEYTVELSRKSGAQLKTLKAKVIFVLMDPYRQRPPPPPSPLARSPPPHRQPRARLSRWTSLSSLSSSEAARPPRRSLPPPERPPPGSTPPPACTEHAYPPPPDYTARSLSKRLGWLPFVPMGRRATNW